MTSRSSNTVWDDFGLVAGLQRREASVTSKNELLKRTVLAPSSVARLRVGDLLSVELTADEHIQWIWCHHGARGSSVIGYTLGSREPVTVLDKQPIGFFPLEEKR